MFELFGATFGSTLAQTLVLVGVTGASVYFFMKRKSNSSQAVTFQQFQSIITQEILDVRELVTTREKFKSFIEIDDDKKIPFLDVHVPGTSRKLLADYSGTIVCGCDLDEIRYSRGFGNRVKIFVPPCKILDAYADMSSIHIRLNDTGIFAKDIKIEEHNELITKDLDSHKRLAVQEGLLERADENVRLMLEQIVNRRGLREHFDVEILPLNATTQNLLG